MNDLVALSSFLVKPKYAIQLYQYENVNRWKLVPRNGDASVIYPSDFTFDLKHEVYQRHDVLELSKMALDIATDDSLCTEHQRLARIHELAKEAEVCFFTQRS